MRDDNQPSIQRVWVRSFWHPTDTLKDQLRLYTTQTEAEHELDHPKMDTYEIIVINHGPASNTESDGE